MPPNSKYAFLSHLVSDYLNSDGTFRPEKRLFVSRAVAALTDLGYEVQAAAVHEDYGAVKLSPVEFTEYDLDAIRRSSLLALIASERLTQDMYLEVGMAVALNIPILFFIPASARVTYMIYGLMELGCLTIVRYESEEEVPELIRITVGELEGSKNRPQRHNEQVDWTSSR